MDNIAVTVLLSFVSVLLTVNLYILKGLREDLKEGIAKIWEKIDVIIEKNDHTFERLVRMEADIDNCEKRWDKKHP